MHWLTIIGIILIGSGTFLTIIGQQKVSEKSADLLQAKSNEIEKLTSQISETNQQISYTVTGGDSFCYLFPDISLEKENTIDFYLQNQGKYPMYDIFIRIWDDSQEENFDYAKLYANISEKYPVNKSKIKSKEDLIKFQKDP